MPYTPDPFAHEALAAQREERLARRAAIHQMLGTRASTTPSPRLRLATILRAVANRLAQPEAAAPVQVSPNHIHIRPESKPGAPLKG